MSLKKTNLWRHLAAPAFFLLAAVQASAQHAAPQPGSEEFTCRIAAGLAGAAMQAYQQGLDREAALASLLEEIGIDAAQNEESRALIVGMAQKSVDTVYQIALKRGETAEQQQQYTAQYTEEVYSLCLQTD